MAIIASISLIVSMFDLTYIPCRDFYFRNLPDVIEQYDRFKGIEPHRETERYLNAVEQLKLTVNQTGLASAQTRSWLQQLDTLSVSLIQNNPFQVAEKTGNLEKIKNQVSESQKESENVIVVEAFDGKCNDFNIQGMTKKCYDILKDYETDFEMSINKVLGKVKT